MKFNLIKPIRYIAIAIFILLLLTLAYCGYDNLNEVRNSTGELDKSINEVIVQWIKEDSEWTQILEDTDKNLAESEAKLDKMFKEAEEIFND